MAAIMVRQALLIAFHYPPSRISSGIHRALKFSQYLGDHGWQANVLSASPRAYQQLGDDQLEEIPSGIVVKRAFALDAARHLAVQGRYPQFVALPDRWATWWLGSVFTGLLMIRRLKPEIIWSTYPIATAHWIGLTLARLTGIPWIADCRDSMTEPGYPAGPRIRRSYLRIEREMVRRASRVVFTAPGTRQMYSERYPDLPREKWSVIPNGYDEQNFRTAEQRYRDRPPNEPLTLIHSGILYPSERDPRHFFSALVKLRKEGLIGPESLRIRLRATGHDDVFRPMIAADGLEDIVSLEAPLTYHEALEEMLSTDGLLLFQASNCNHQIPAKLYEYLRARRPIFALTDPAGDSAAVLRSAGIDTIVRLNSTQDIFDGLREFLTAVKEGRAPVATDDAIAQHSRDVGAAHLARLFSEAAT